MKKLVLLAFALAGLSGCATIVKGSSQTMNVATGTGKQVNAVVTSANGTMPVLLPQAVSVEKSSDDIIINITESECIVPSTTIIKSNLSGWFWGNIIFGGLLGSTTDLASGSAWEYDNNVLVNVAEKEKCSKN